MARHSAMQIVPEFMLKSSLDIKKHVYAKLLDVLMRAVADWVDPWKITHWMPAPQGPEPPEEET